ncbi:MAG: hypothetical protein NUV53_05355 [Patescibacteria group bacterium]|nr:hypothetical protein [Patescibacteria group bacterium]
MTQNNKVGVRKNINVWRVSKIMMVSIVPIFLLGLFWYQAYAQSSVRHPDAYVKESAVSDIPSQKKTTMFEIHIASNGAMFLQGARVISITSDGMHVITEWDSGDFTWGVQTNFFTKFTTSKGEKMTSESIHVGDVLTVSGKLIKGGSSPIIAADFVRE